MESWLPSQFWITVNLSDQIYNQKLYLEYKTSEIYQNDKKYNMTTEGCNISQSPWWTISGTDLWDKTIRIINKTVWKNGHLLGSQQYQLKLLSMHKTINNSIIQGCHGICMIYEWKIKGTPMYCACVLTKSVDHSLKCKLDCNTSMRDNLVRDSEAQIMREFCRIEMFKC